MNPLPKDTIEFNKALEINQQREEEERKFQEENEANKKEAGEAVRELIWNSSEPFSYSDIEDIMSGYGLEMDGIEDMIF